MNSSTERESYELVPRSYMQRHQVLGWVRLNPVNAESALGDRGVLHGVDDKTQPTQGLSLDRSPCASLVVEGGFMVLRGMALRARVSHLDCEPNHQARPQLSSNKQSVQP